MPKTKSHISGLLISAGFSKRMGAFKPLMEFEEETFVVTIVRKLLLVCKNVVVVTGYNKELIEMEMNKLSSGRIILAHNPDFEKGMFTSLQTGLRQLKDSDWVLYHFIDQPFHKERFYTEFITQITKEADWIQPSYSGKTGHPILFNRKISDLILNGSPDSNLRLIRDLPDKKKVSWECGYKEVLLDFDTPDDINDYQISAR